MTVNRREESMLSIRPGIRLKTGLLFVTQRGDYLYRNIDPWRWS